MRILSTGVRVSSAATAAAVLGGVLALGAVFDFTSIGAHALFAASSLALVASAWRLAAPFDGREWIERVVRAVVIGFAVVVFLGLLLGAAGALTIASVLGCECALLGVVAAYRPSATE